MKQTKPTIIRARTFPEMPLSIGKSFAHNIKKPRMRVIAAQRRSDLPLQGVRADSIKTSVSIRPIGLLSCVVQQSSHMLEVNPALKKHLP